MTCPFLASVATWPPLAPFDSVAAAFRAPTLELLSSLPAIRAFAASSPLSEAFRPSLAARLVWKWSVLAFRPSVPKIHRCLSRFQTLPLGRTALT